MEENKKKKFSLSERTINIIIIIAFLLILFSFIAPITLTSFSWFDFTDKGEIGDTIGGIMNPFIAIAGVVLTYLAFYMQFEANRIQKEQFRNELKEQRTQFSKDQIEGQFYEMIKLHKENVNEISLEIFDRITNKGKVITGRKVFQFYLKEIEILFSIVKERFFPVKGKNFCIHLAYHYFLNGLKDVSLYENPTNDPYKNVINDIFQVNSLISLQGGVETYSNSDSSMERLVNKYNLNHKIVIGHSNYLGHYYRHLFQAVKFIANQNEELISYSDKRKYLRFLRAQLSNEEQAIMFYNWKSEYGKKWEDETNKFFTDYRMIHNIPENMIILDFNIFDEFNKEYRKEEKRTDDFLFEVQS